MWKCASVEINIIQYQCPVSLDTGADRWILAACIFAHLHIERRKRQSQQFLKLLTNNNGMGYRISDTGAMAARKMSKSSITTRRTR